MSERFLIFDVETRSECDLKKCGAYEYAKHPTTLVFCVSWCIGTLDDIEDAPIKTWSPTFGGPKEEFLNACRDASVTLVAHNSSFERYITNFVLSRVLKEPLLEEIGPERFICTAALAASLALPRALEAACNAFDLGVEKDMEGRRLILKYTKPRRETKNNKAKWHNNLSDLKRIIEYCEKDIIAERALFLKAIPLSPKERSIWLLDQKINTRGVSVDRELVNTTLGLIALEKERIENTTRIVSKGEIESTTQRDATLKWLRAQGVQIDNLQAGTIRELIASGKVDGPALTILRARQAASKSSTAKYESFEARSRVDGRVRDNLIYYGASTGRFCIPEEAQVLTPTGWVSFKDDANFGKIMCWDSKKDCLVFTKPKAIHVFEGQERLLCWANRNTHVAVTSEHRVPVIPTRGGLRVDKAKQLAGKGFITPISSKISGLKYLSEIKTKILVMVQADGHFYSGPKGTGIRFGFRKQRKIKRCQELLTKGKIKFKTRFEKSGTVRIVIARKDIPEYLSAFKDKTFKYSEHIFNPKIFLNELILWDGYQEKGLNSFEYSTCNKQNAVFAQTMAHLVGFAARIQSRDRNEKWNTNYRVFVRKTNRNRFTKQDFKSIEYKGKTWCPEVSTGFFLCRYNDTIFITGNSGAGVQLQNLPRPLIKDTDTLAEVIKQKDLELVRLIYGDPMGAFSSALRSCIVPSPGHELFVADYNAIEVRVLFWLAGHTKGVEAFLKGRDLYVEMAAKIYKKDPFEITKEERQLGKTVILGAGYGLGADKFFESCKNAGMQVTEELARDAINSYRDTHWPVKKLWDDLNRACVSAVAHGSKKFTVGGISYFMDGDFLFCELPSERRLAYYRPELTQELTPWGESRASVSSWATNSMTKKWEKYKIYGGLLAENCTQAVARDLMAEAMLRIEESGYNILVSVHDELISEKEIGAGNVEEYCSLMSRLPSWGAGCPVKTEGWSGMRYKK